MTNYYTHNEHGGQLKRLLSLKSIANETSPLYDKPTQGLPSSVGMKEKSSSLFRPTGEDIF